MDFLKKQVPVIIPVIMGLFILISGISRDNEVSSLESELEEQKAKIEEIRKTYDTANDSFENLQMTINHFSDTDWRIVVPDVESDAISLSGDLSSLDDAIIAAER